MGRPAVITTMLLRRQCSLRLQICLLPLQTGDTRPGTEPDPAFADVHLAQRWPGFQEHPDPFFLVLLGAGLGRGVTLQTLLIDLQGVGEGHLALDVARGMSGGVALGLLQVGQPQLRHRKHLGFERASNELALDSNSCE